ncbi:MAG: GNAT family N-acetyltransferase [Actinomycetota bacterium]|nr:GNAT family N-acetyltransferase [Actinomycetota bacterium]
MLERSWIGRRVTVRRVIGRDRQGRPAMADVVGDLVDLDATRGVIDARGGLVEVPLDRVAVARLAYPATRDVLDLEAVVARGWRAEQTAEIGGWVLRANGGFTQRANSVLPLGQPGLPLDDALAQARAWYASRGLPLQVQVPTEARRLLDSALAELGWASSPDVHVMAARLDTLRSADRDPPPGDGAQVEVADRLDEGWLARYRGGAGTTAAARGLLLNHDRVGFAAVRRGGETVAVGRATVDDDWLGITAVEVAPAQRRTGLASALMSALWRWGEAAGARRSHLEVSADNEAAVALYSRLGYWVHHDYRYRYDPPTE